MVCSLGWKRRILRCECVQRRDAWEYTRIPHQRLPYGDTLPGTPDEILVK
jgi:hypothetical protein